VGGLAAEEGDGGGCLRGGAQHLAGVTLDTARQVDRQAGHPPRIHRFEHGARHALQRPRQAGAEEGIDRERCAVEDGGRQCRDLARPAGRSSGGIAA